MGQTQSVREKTDQTTSKQKEFQEELNNIVSGVNTQPIRSSSYARVNVTKLYTDMAMGNSSSKNVLKKHPDFTDDFTSYKIPYDLHNNKERKKFDKELEDRLKQEGEHKILEDVLYRNQTLERVLFLCLFELSERSFDYHCLAKEIRGQQEFKKKIELMETNTFCTQEFLKTIRRNLEVITTFEVSMEVNAEKGKETGDFSVRCKPPRKMRNISKEQSEVSILNTPVEKFNEYQNVSIDIGQQTLVNDTEEDTSPVHSNSDEMIEPAIKEPNTESTIETETKWTHRKKKNEQDSFSRLIEEEIKKTDGEQEEKLKQMDKVIEIQKNELDRKKKEDDASFEKEIADSEEKRKKREDCFRESEDLKQQVHEEEMKRCRKKREDYEKETEKIRQADMDEFNRKIAILVHCIALKQKWDTKEDDWANWLKLFRTWICRAKNQFSYFEESIRLIETYGQNEIQLIKEELLLLHTVTRGTFDSLYEACFEIKKLSEQFPDRLFLAILQKQLSNVCSMVSSVLYGIDNAKIDEDLSSVLRGLFSSFDSFDIFSTSKLRDLEKTAIMEKYTNIKDPMVYEPKSCTKVEEIPKEVEENNLGIQELSENQKTVQPGHATSDIDQLRKSGDGDLSDSSISKELKENSSNSEDDKMMYETPNENEEDHGKHQKEKEENIPKRQENLDPENTSDVLVNENTPC